jgi:signal transduction histidine kinase
MTIGTSTPPNGNPAADAASTAQGGNALGPGRHTSRKSRRLSRRPARLSLSNWPVSTRLVGVFMVASVTGLVFGGLRVSDAISTSDAYGRTAQVALLGEQATNLAQAMEDERDLSAGYAAYGILAAAAKTNNAAPSVTKSINTAETTAHNALTGAEQVTNADAQQVSTLAAAIGPGFPVSVQAKAQSVITMIDSIPGLRSALAGEPAAQVIVNYSNSIGDLFVLNDEITSGSGDAQLADEVLALGALSRAKDQASQQRAFVYSTLLEVSVSNAGGGKHAASNNASSAQALEDAGGLGTLTTSQGLEFNDLTGFTDAATTDQSNSYLATVAGPQQNDAQLIEGFISLPNDPRLVFERIGNKTSLGYDQATVASTWYSDMTAVIGQMRTIETQVVSSIVTRSQTLERGALNSAVLTASVSGAAVLLVLLATALVGRTLVNPLRRLQADALEIAAVRLPARVAAAAAGTEATDGAPVIEPIGVQSTDEIGRVARAFDQVHAEAVRLAGTEAQLRGSLNAMFISLSRRSVPLIERMARMIDVMEQSEDDPEQLAKLFSMDHLITRMRRNSENLLVLAGEEPVRKWTDSVPLTDVARAAASEIEQYSRVALAVQPGIMISGQAAADVVHLLAELIENATLFSPQSTQVRVTVMELSSGGVLVEVRDDGVGVSPNRLSDMNWRLDHPPVVDVSISRHMGLYAVSRLAARHGIRVKLRPGTPQGLSALVWLPGTLAKHEPGQAASSHSGSWGLDTTGPVSTIRSTPAKYMTGRHRTGLAAGGEQPVTDEQPLPVRPGRPDEQPLPVRPGRTDEQPLSVRPVRPGGQRARSAAATAWFAAKRPSSGTTVSEEDLAVGWRSTASSGNADDGAAAGHAELTSSGLPRRVPRTSGRPGSDTPGSAVPFAMPFTGPGAEAPVLAAPLDGMASQGVTYQEATHQEPVPARRRTPEAARSRLSGFQLGSRDAVQAGPTGRAPLAGEENSR